MLDCSSIFEVHSLRRVMTIYLTFDSTISRNERENGFYNNICPFVNMIGNGGMSRYGTCKIVVMGNSFIYVTYIAF